jgi:hypothetical protein
MADLFGHWVGRRAAGHGDSYSAHEEPGYPRRSFIVVELKAYSSENGGYLSVTRMNA